MWFLHECWYPNYLQMAITETNQPWGYIIYGQTHFVGQGLVATNLQAGLRIRMIFLDIFERERESVTLAAVPEG